MKSLTTARTTITTIILTIAVIAIPAWYLGHSAGTEQAEQAMSGWLRSRLPLTRSA